MKLPNYQLSDPILPTESEAQTAAIASKILASYLEEKQPKYKLKLIKDETQSQTIELPAIAFYILLEFLRHTAGGKAVELNPINQEITISQAANILGVSRSYLVEKMNSGEIHIEKSKYGLFYRDVIDYKNNRDSQRMKALEELAAEAQKLNLG